MDHSLKLFFEVLINLPHDIRHYRLEHNDTVIYISDTLQTVCDLHATVDLIAMQNMSSHDRSSLRM